MTRSRRRTALGFLLTAMGIARGEIPAVAPESLDTFNVVWNSPSRDAAGSMPIGNGELGLNVWVEEDGDLRFYLARSDALSSKPDLVKLGALRVALSPNPFLKGRPFRQSLKLRQGCIDIEAGAEGEKVALKILVDAQHPVLHVTGISDKPLQVRASYETWHAGAEQEKIVPAPGPIVVWYTRNEDSPVAWSLKRQQLGELAESYKDSLLYRTYGGRMEGLGFAKVAPQSLETPEAVRKFDLRVATHSMIAPVISQWSLAIKTLSGESSDGALVEKRTAEWWENFWGRSWLIMKGDEWSRPFLKNNQDLALGSDARGERGFVGVMSRASFYNRPLTENEILQLAAGRPDSANSLSDGRTLALQFKTLPGECENRGGVTLVTRDNVPGALFSGKQSLMIPSDRLDQSQGFSFEGWVYLDSTGPDGLLLLDKTTPGLSDGISIWQYGSKLTFQTGSQPAPAENLWASRVLPGKWSHVALACNPVLRSRQLWINGLLARSDGGGCDQPTSSAVTRAYLLQRWISACAGRGEYPIKANGSLFTVEPGLVSPDMRGKESPDFRLTGRYYQWQPTRLAYYPLLASGDLDSLAGLFKFYEGIVPLSKARTKATYKADGLTFPEVLQSFGTWSEHEFGDGKELPGFLPNRYTWHQALELTFMMLSYYEQTQDEEFLTGRLIPMAREALLYYDTRFKRDGAEKLIITPTNVAATFVTDPKNASEVINDIPSVAALRELPRRLLEIASAKASPEDLALWKRLELSAPSVEFLVDRGVKIIAPAAKFPSNRWNNENVELYAIWPFKLFSISRPQLDVARETFNRRAYRYTYGSTTEGQVAALLGLTDDARRILMAKAAAGHGGFRFPAMWGPNSQWLPDQSHGGNLMSTFQSMVMHTDGKQIFLFPAWPATWDLDFKLHAPYQTVLVGRVSRGKLLKLEVFPESRRADVVIPKAFESPS